MNIGKLICGHENITYENGYISLWLTDYPLPEIFAIAGETLHKKDRFHVSLLCVRDILEIKPDIEDKILEHFCDFCKENQIHFEGFSKEFRLARDDDRMSVVALCKILNLDKFAEYLTDKIGINIAPQPAHLTIYTLQPNVGIGLNSPEEMELKTKLITVPEAVLAPLMGYKKIVVVDNDNNIIGAEYMMDAIKQGMIRRSSRVCVFNESGQLLVQQRGRHVLKPLLLDLSAAGHVDSDESYEQAAYRELEEELGLTNITLETIVISIRTTDFFSAVYKTVIPDNTPINFESEEIEAVFWYDINTLDSQLISEPERFTPAFKETWSLLKHKLVTN